jgi:hypothetical protein
VRRIAAEAGIRRATVLAAAAAALPASIAAAQSPADLAASMRPMNDPGTELQRLLNVQDAEYRQQYFGNTPIAEIGRAHV